MIPRLRLSEALRAMRNRPPRRRVVDHSYPVLRLGDGSKFGPYKVLRDLLECGHTLAPLLRAPKSRRCWKCKRGLRPDIKQPAA